MNLWQFHLFRLYFSCMEICQWDSLHFDSISIAGPSCVLQILGFPHLKSINEALLAFLRAIPTTNGEHFLPDPNSMPEEEYSTTQIAIYFQSAPHHIE